MGRASRYFKHKGSMKKMSTSPRDSFKKKKKFQFIDIDCGRVTKPEIGRASQRYKRNVKKISTPPRHFFAKNKKLEIIDIDSCRIGNPEMGRASRHYKRNMQKISTPSQNSCSKTHKPQIIDIDGGRIANPEIICLDGNNRQKRNPQLIDLEDDDVTVLPVHATNFQKGKLSKNKSKNDIFILDDDILIDALSDSTKQSAYVVNSHQQENKLSVGKEKLNLKDLGSYSSENNHSSALPDVPIPNVEQLLNSKIQPLLPVPVSNPCPEPVLENSCKNSLDSSPSCKAELSSLLVSGQVPSNFTPYKRTFDLPDLNDINCLKKEENILNVPSENNPCESASVLVNNCTINPSIVQNKANSRNKCKSVKEVTAPQTSNNTTNHRYPLRSRGLSAPAPRKSFPKPNSQNKKLAVKKNKRDSGKLPSPTPDHSDQSWSTSRNIVESVNASIDTSTPAKAPDKKIETKVYVSPKGENEDRLLRKSKSTSPALNFIPIPPASKEIEDELVQIYNNNKNRKSMKTDFSSIKINLEGAADESSTLKKGLTKKQQKNELWKIAQKEKSLQKKQCRKQRALCKNSNGKSKLKKFEGLKTLKKKGKRSLQKSKSPKNTRMSYECNDPCHSTPFPKQSRQSRKRKSERSLINFSNRSFGNFNWITLDAYHTDSGDQSHSSENSASHNSPVIAAVSPTNYGSNSPHDRSLRSRNKSESSSCEEIPMDTERIDSGKEVVVIDDRDAAADISDTLSLSSEESFSVDIGSNVFVPDSVSFKGRRPIIIDGSNVAFSHGISTRGLRVFSSRGIEICAKYFTKRGHKVIVFIPMFRRWSCQTLNPEILQKMSDKGLITYTPSRKIKSKLSVPYDDRYIVQCAVALGGVIVSTDNYKDLLKENRTWKNTIEKRLLMFTFVGDMLMFPQDPLGRHGPKLDDFLMFPR